MERALSYGTLIVAATIMLAFADAAHAGSPVGVRGATFTGNYVGGCRGPSCSVRGPTPTTVQKRCRTYGPQPGHGGHAYTLC